jgi:protein ImuA
MNLATLRSSGQIPSIRVPPPQGIRFPFELGVTGLHEVAEAGYGDLAAATGFLLAALEKRPRGAWIWVRQSAIGRDCGDVPASALFGDMSRLRLTVHARNTREALWATEEAVVSGGACLVVAEVETADFTATRRLALASGRHGVPVVLLMPHTCQGATAAATRWRVSPHSSSPNRFDPQAPGNPRWQAVLERCRIAPAATGQTFDLEWNDETLSLTVAAGLAAGPPAPRLAPKDDAPHRKAG